MISEITREFKNNLTDLEWESLNVVQKFASSSYLQKLYVKSNCTLIEPEEIYCESFSYHYVPLDKIAKLVLSNSSIVGQILFEQSSNFSFGFNDYQSEMTCNYERWT